MTKLFEEPIQRLESLPESMQDTAARTMMLLVEEEPEPGDDDAIREAGSVRPVTTSPLQSPKRARSA